MVGLKINLNSVPDIWTKSRSSTRQRKNSCRLVGPFVNPDQEAVRRFMKECLVPLLAEEFLSQRDAAAENTVPQQTDFQPLRQETGPTDHKNK